MEQNKRWRRSCLTLGTWHSILTGLSCTHMYQKSQTKGKLKVEFRIPDTFPLLLDAFSIERYVCTHMCTHIWTLHWYRKSQRSFSYGLCRISASYLCFLASLTFWINNQLQQSIIRPHRKNSACFSLRTKVYKMRFDSSTLNSTGDVSLGEMSTP